MLVFVLTVLFQQASGGGWDWLSANKNNNTEAAALEVDSRHEEKTKKGERGWVI